MTEQTPPPPPPSTTPPGAPPASREKKGMPTWAWVAIGCGVLLLVVLLALGAGCWILGGKVKDFAEKYEENPEIASIELIAATNREIELVETDAEAGKATIRNTETGQVVEVDFEDLKEGKIRWTVDGEKGSYEVDREGGTVRVETEGEEGVETAEFGRGEAPEWLPVFPGAEYAGGFKSTSGGRASGTISYETDGDLEEIVEFYRGWMEEEGFEISETTYSSQGETVRGLQGEQGDRSLTVTVQRSEGEPSKIGLVFDGPA